MERKGFFFVVTIFLILTYILLSISVWVKGIQSSERLYSEFYKESSVELAIEQITPTRVDNITQMILTRGLYRINDYSSDYPIKPGSVSDPYSNLKSALFDSLVSGKISGDYFEKGASDLSPEPDSSLEGWVKGLNSSLQSVGAYVESYSVTNFKISQEKYDSLNYSFDLVLILKDVSNYSSVNRTYNIKNSVPISGLVDPAILRESKKKTGIGIYRQFYFNSNYLNPTDLSVNSIGSVHEGQGWYYGYLISTSSATTVPIELKQNYILVGSYSDIETLGALGEGFGAYILTSKPLMSGSCNGDTSKGDQSLTFNPISYKLIGTDCKAEFSSSLVSVPFVVSENFKIESAPDCPDPESKTIKRKCALIVSAFSQKDVSSDPYKKFATSSSNGIYGIEEVRDFVMCGYYVPSTYAPSYLQRLLPDSYYHSDPNGIETFVIGEYANFPAYASKSRLDRELFNDTAVGIHVRGLPGCKTSEMCSAQPPPVTGIFSISSNVKSQYPDLARLLCDLGARCE